MDAPDLSIPPETSRDLIELRDEDAITINEALAIADELSFSIGKSTLQRWTRLWHDRPGGAVKCVFVTTRRGNFYKLSRENFQAWVFDQKQNEKSNEAPRDPARPSKVSSGLERPREVSSETADNGGQLKELQNEIMQLKIDVGVRKQLLERAKEEVDDLRSMTNNLLRENGSLQFQIHQLAPPAPKRDVGNQQTETVDNSPQINDTPPL